eukprot:scaffold111621_cov36-Phaeocystis_antarctica.AAC.1
MQRGGRCRRRARGRSRRPHHRPPPVRSMPLEHLERGQCGQWASAGSFKVHLGIAPESGPWAEPF